MSLTPYQEDRLRKQGTHVDRQPPESRARFEAAWRMKQDGKTFAQIAERLGVSRGRAWQMVAFCERRLEYQEYLKSKS